MKSMNKTSTPELSPEVLERLRVYAAPFQAELRHEAQRSWSGVYLRGLLQGGERKSLEAMVGRVPLPAELRDLQEPDQALQQFVNQSPWDHQKLLQRYRTVMAQPFFSGTLAPFLRALERPMAMACLGLVTFFFDLLPLRSVPSFISCIASLTSSWAFFPYFAM